MNPPYLCETCCHWGPTDNDMYGLCQNPRISFAASDCMWPGHNIQEKRITGPKFGCIHHSVEYRMMINETTFQKPNISPAS